MRSARVRAILGMAVLLLAACGGEQEAAQPAAPAVTDHRPAAVRRFAGPPVDNVLLVTVDTLRADALGYAGETAVETPNLDRLAARGLVFSDAHAHSVVTLPSHVNILTGLYPYQHGVRENSGFRLADTRTADSSSGRSIPVDTAATLFSRAGFATGAVVGSFILSARYGLDRGFDLYEDRFNKGWDGTALASPERRGSEVVERGLAWWREHQGGRRFLWLHLYDPHAPYAPPEPFASRYAADPYLGEVAATDSYLGPLLAPFLEGAEPSTLIVFTGDHGEALGDHGEITHGFFAYEATLKIPLILWAPGLQSGTVDRLVRHVDLLPTMLDAAGLEAPGGLPGRSLLEDGGNAPVVSYLEALSPNLNRGWAPLRGVLRDQIKFISVPLPELYDLSLDPDETDNRIEEERLTAQELNRLLPREEPWPPARRALSEGEQAMLLSLGYLSGEAKGKEVYTAEDDPKNLVQLDGTLHEVIAALQTGEVERAERLTRQVIAQRPMAVAYKLLARALVLQDREEEAVEALEAAVRTGYADTGVLRQLALSLNQVGRAAEAVRILWPVRENADPETLDALASALVEAGRLGDARSVLERSLELEPNNPLTYETLALAALRDGSWEATRRYAERAVSIDGGLSLAWNYLGGARYNLGNPTGAVEAWERCVDNDPGNFDALFNIAVVSGELGDRQRSRAALQRFVAEAPASRYSEDIERAKAWLRDLG